MHLLCRQLEEQVQQSGQQNDGMPRYPHRGASLLAALNQQSAIETTIAALEPKPASGRRLACVTPADKHARQQGTEERVVSKPGNQPTN